VRAYRQATGFLAISRCHVGRCACVFDNQATYSAEGLGACVHARAKQHNTALHCSVP
jgi:hypothetical protein